MQRDLWSSLAVALVLIVLWAPTAHAALVSHYDASTIAGIVDGGSVTLWNDISGQNNHATAPGGGNTRYAATGIGGRPAVRFTGGSGFVSNLAMGSSFGIQGDAAWSMVMVFRQTQLSYGWSQVATLGTGASPHTGALVELEDGNLDFATGFGQDVRLNPYGSFGQFLNEDLILIYTHRGNTADSILSTIDLWIDGYAPGQGVLSGLALGALGDTATAPLNLADRSFVLGGSSHSATGSFTGLLAEAMVFNHELGNAERDSIVAQLGSKYGIAVNAVIVPEPAGLVLLALGAIGICVPRRRSLAV